MLATSGLSAGVVNDADVRVGAMVGNVLDITGDACGKVGKVLGGVAVAPGALAREPEHEVTASINNTTIETNFKCVSGCFQRILLYLASK